MSFLVYRRSISSKISHLAPRLQPSLSHIIGRDDEINRRSGTDEIQSQASSFPWKQVYHHMKYFGICGHSYGKKNVAQPFSASLYGSSFCRYYSSAPAEGSDNLTYMTDVTEILSDKSAEVVAAQLSTVNEVAIAAADSIFPVAALQYMIDGVHSFTGLNWWASIMITTLLIRTATVPLLINSLKATLKLAQIKPEIEAIREQLMNTVDPKEAAECQKKWKDLFTKHGVSPFTPLKGIFVQGPIFMSFFFAISNMAEKVPSFKTGGTLWFIDLTTVDSLYILPVVTALTFLLTVELHSLTGMEGNSSGATMKNCMRVLAVVSVPLTMGFHKAIFFYWATSNVFSLVYGQIIKRPSVKRYLDLPEVTVSSSEKTSMTFDSVMGKFKAIFEQGSSNSLEASADQKPKISESSAIIAQRRQNLEKPVTTKKKRKRRQRS